MRICKLFGIVDRSVLLISTVVKIVSVLPVLVLNISSGEREENNVDNKVFISII